MNTIFDIVDYKTDIKGFWHDNKGKIYIDNVKIYYPQNIEDFNIKLLLMFDKKEKAVFCTSKDKGFIVYENKEHDTYNKIIELKRDKLSFNEIKSLIYAYGGLTIFDRKSNVYERFLIKIWTN